jgi:two-component system NtrC family sensor kinase
MMFLKEDGMDTSRNSHPAHLLNHSVPAKNIWTDMTHTPDRNSAMAPPKLSIVLQQGNGALPPTLENPLRIALYMTHPKSVQTLSLLEQLPGVDIVGVAEQQIQDQKSVSQSSPVQNQPFPAETPTDFLLDHTAPHVLLDFTADPRIQTLGNQETFSNTEIPGPYTASLFEKLAAHKSGLERQMAQIEQLANIGTLASGILHNISNPLYVILGFSEMLLEEAQTPTVREQALEVVQATQRIIKMCKDLNVYARQRTSDECTMVDLTQQLEEALKVARFSVGMENMTVIRRYAAHPIIFARPEEVLQIFVNLIMNALQAMEGEGLLTLETEMTDQKALISIKDTGPGIPHTHMQKIFDPFYTTKPAGKGTGLGLHSVRSLVHQYQGQVFLHSVVGEGTTFHLEFPLPSEPMLGQTA